MRLLSAIATVGGYTMASRVLGFVRDILIAALLGAGPVADAFFVAFKLPNFFRRLFAEGAFSAAFVPLFTRILGEEGDVVGGKVGLPYRHIVDQAGKHRALKIRPVSYTHLTLPTKRIV